MRMETYNNINYIHPPHSSAREYPTLHVPNCSQHAAKRFRKSERSDKSCPMSIRNCPGTSYLAYLMVTFQKP